jgi:hypothetical protein
MLTFKIYIFNKKHTGMLQMTLGIRPAWMQELQKMQEQFSATPSMEIQNEKYR